METIQKATLVLKSCDLPTPGTSDSYGTVNIDRTIMTWYNINLRLLLCDMYDKHDLFNLKLNTVSFSSLSDPQDASGNYKYLFGDDPDDRIVNIQIEGLSFINNSYNTMTGNNTSKAQLCVYKFDYEKQLVNYNNNAIVTFAKGSDKNNIIISYENFNSGDPPSTLQGNWFPNVIFNFSIYGVPRERKPERMINY